MGLDQNLTALNSFLKNLNSLSKPMSCSYIQSIAARKGKYNKIILREKKIKKKRKKIKSIKKKKNL
jgi:predicted transcriptional regulator